MFKQSAPPRRRGITLIEVVIVIAIVTLLAIVLIPALQSARGKARLQQCKNNLKQFALALHNYHDAHSTFPPGFVLAENGVYHGWGWGELITPYLDSSPYYTTIKFGAGLQSEYNKPHMNPVYSVYRCPADPGSTHLEHAYVVTTNVVKEQVTPGTTDAVKTFSRSNYFGVVGYLETEFGGIELNSDQRPADPPIQVNDGSLGHLGISPRPGRRYCDTKNFRGIFGQNSNTRIQDINEGCSNTIMVGERYTPQDTAVNAIGHGTFLGVPDCTTAAGLAMTLGDGSVRINAGVNGRAQTTGFGSNHRGGAHLMIADGSVRFVANTIDLEAYRKLSTATGDYWGSDF